MCVYLSGCRLVGEPLYMCIHVGVYLHVCIVCLCVFIWVCIVVFAFVHAFAFVLAGCMSVCIVCFLV